MNVGAELDMTAERAWELLSDTGHWHAWGPSVAAVEPAGVRVSPGLRGRVRTVAGFSLPFEITEVEPGRSWRWKVAGVTATGHRVVPLGPGRCRVDFEVPAWAAPYGLVCLVALKRLARMALPPGGSD